MAEVDDFLLRLVHHGVQGIDLFDFWIQVVLDDFHEHVDEAAVVDLVQIAVVQPFVLVLEFDLAEEEVVLYVLFEHGLGEVGLEFVPDDLGDFLEDLEEVSHHDLLPPHGQPDLLLDGGHIAAGQQELVNIRDLPFGRLP